MSDLISIKGGRDGLRMQLDEAAEWPAIVAALRVQLDQGGTFFAGAKLTVDVGERALGEAQLAEILELMQHHGVQPEALLASDRESRSAGRAAGLTARPVPPRTSAGPAAQEPEAMLICRTVRSGQVIRHPGHVTLIGDVNPGAEVIAGGSVVVWGRLRGLAHAGALGDRQALVCALELRPTQLRIADLITRTPEGTSGNGPEVARVDGEHIAVEAWGRGSRQ